MAVNNENKGTVLVLLNVKKVREELDKEIKLLEDLLQFVKDTQKDTKFFDLPEQLTLGLYEDKTKRALEQIKTAREIL